MDGLFVSRQGHIVVSDMYYTLSYSLLYRDG